MADSGKGVSGVAVAAVFVGGILAWSGVKGFSVSTTLKDFIAGKNPSKQTATESVTPGGLFGSLFGSVLGGLLGGGSNSGGSNVNAIVSGPGITAFAKGLLTAIGAPLTSANIASIASWAQREGGGGANNPLNTTLGPSSATNFNSVGVKNFASLTEGATYSARTLLGGGYSDILAALRSGNGLCGSNVSSGLSTWSGGGYSSVC
jgi:hypothetical protein